MRVLQIKYRKVRIISSFINRFYKRIFQRSRLLAICWYSGSVQLGHLKAAGLVTVRAGEGGAFLAQDAKILL